MAKFLKKFDTHTEYETYIETREGREAPNVSICKDDKGLHYNGLSFVTTAFTSSTTPRKMCNDITQIQYIECNGEKIDVTTDYRTFEPSGTNFILTYALLNTTELGGAMFKKCSFTKFTIGNGIEVVTGEWENTSFSELIIGNETKKIISGYAFANKSSLLRVTIGTGITSIDYGVFANCTNLSSVTILATTPPKIWNNIFENNAEGRKIYVPAASLNAYKTADGWSTYAADIEAIA